MINTNTSTNSTGNMDISDTKYLFQESSPDKTNKNDDNTICNNVNKKRDTSKDRENKNSQSNKGSNRERLENAKKDLGISGKNLPIKVSQEPKSNTDK